MAPRITPSQGAEDFQRRGYPLRRANSCVQWFPQHDQGVGRPRPSCRLLKHGFDKSSCRCLNAASSWKLCFMKLGIGRSLGDTAALLRAQTLTRHRFPVSGCNVAVLPPMATKRQALRSQKFSSAGCPVRCANHPERPETLHLIHSNPLFNPPQTSCPPPKSPSSSSCPRSPASSTSDKPYPVSPAFSNPKNSSQASARA